MIELANEKNKKVGIFGLARTGIASYKALQGKVAKLIAWDDSESNRQIYEKEFGSESLIPIEKDDWKDLDEIVLSPGVPTSLPKPHRIAEIAKEHNIKLISDLDLLYRAKKDSKIIAVTGTNGKSTCAALIHHVLNKAGYKWDLGGNIGNAALNMDNDAEGYVLEVSSFQIELSKEFKADIAVLLNITPDHLDRHGTMEEYIRVKRSLVENAEKVVIGFDNKITRKIFNDLYKIRERGDVHPFTTEEILSYGTSIWDFEVYDYGYYIESYRLLECKKLIGNHNLENMAATFATCRMCKIDPEVIIRSMATFEGLPHRIQYLGRKNGVDFYNDSKATNMESVRTAIKSLNNIHLLAGGVRKKDGIDSILDLKGHISHAYFYGEAAESFAKEAGEAINHDIYDTLEDSFNEALKKASKHPYAATILLSPGCASFDQFKDFEDRGYRFIELYDKI